MFGGSPEGGPTFSRQISPGAKVGKANGLTLLLDAETYDYSYHHHASEGFKVIGDIKAIKGMAFFFFFRSPSSIIWISL